MKSSVALAVAGLAARAAAQVSACASLTTLFPACATGCILSAASAVGCNNGLDLECRCDPKSSAAIQASALNCVVAGCPASALGAAINAGAAVCSCVKNPPTATAVATSTSAPVVVTTTSAAPAPTTDVPAPTATAPSCGTSSACNALADDVNTCGKQCAIDAAATVGGCAAGDYDCLCANWVPLQDVALGCVLGGCGDGDELMDFLGDVESLCSCIAENPSTACPSSEPASSEPSAEPTVAPTSAEPSSAVPSAEPSSVEPSSAEPSSAEPSVEPSSAAPSAGVTSSLPISCSLGPDRTSDCGPVATAVVPACAQSCFKSAAPGVGCGVDDYACQCQPEARASLSALLIPCVLDGCAATAIPDVIAGADSVCVCATAAPIPGTTECEANTTEEPTSKPTGGASSGAASSGAASSGAASSGAASSGAASSGKPTDGGSHASETTSCASDTESPSSPAAGSSKPGQSQPSYPVPTKSGQAGSSQAGHSQAGQTGHSTLSTKPATSPNSPSSSEPAAVPAGSGRLALVSSSSLVAAVLFAVAMM